MSSQQFYLPRSISRDAVIARAATALRSLPLDKAWTVDIAEFRPKRSLSQNALLWAMYAEILQKGGEELGGFTKDDLHEFFLIDHFGHEVKGMFGRKRIIPLKRSAGLNKQEFSDLVDHILQFMAERGIVINDGRDQQ